MSPQLQAAVMGLAAGYGLGVAIITFGVPFVVALGMKLVLPEDVAHGDLWSADSLKIVDVVSWHIGVVTTALAIFTACSPMDTQAERHMRFGSVSFFLGIGE